MDLTPDGALGIINMFKYLKEKFKTPAQKRAEEAAALEETAALEEKRKKQEAARAKRAAKKATKQKTPKELATEAGEPYVSVLNMELDPKDFGQGSFELDWNDIFVARLIKAGYQGKTDVDIVDNWFRTICRHISLEMWEQAAADPANPEYKIQRKNLGNGRTEIS